MGDTTFNLLYKNMTNTQAIVPLDKAFVTSDDNGNVYNPVDTVAASGICDLRHEVAALTGVVKDSECNIRHDAVKAESEIRRDVAKSESEIRTDVIKEGQENMAATKSAECAVTKEVMETKFVVTKEVLETKHTLAKDILRSEYENKLAIQTALKEIKENAQHNAERTQDQLKHGFEETTEQLTAFEKSTDGKFYALNTKIDKCCCETQAAIQSLKTSALETALADAKTTISQQGLINAVVDVLGNKIK